MEAYQSTVEEVVSQFKTDLKKGLISADSYKRLPKYGPNLLPRIKPISIFTVFIQQFLGPLMLILLIATAASLLIGEYKDAIVIALAIAINVIIGFAQEWKAEKAAEKLRSFETPRCTVRRDGRVILIESENLVPGDVVLLSAGSKIPADVRLTSVVDFKVQEALLTGESEASLKHADSIEEKVTVGDRENMAFMGTFVLHGRAEGVVVKTGVSTHLGEIAQLILKPEIGVTPIQEQLRRFSWLLGFIMFAVAALIFVIGIFRQFDFKELISISIALAVAAVPEGLLVAVTVILAIGMQRMLKRNALVRRLLAAETLGSVSVICTDKTGTITEGKLSVVRVVTPNVDISLEERVSDEVYDLLVMMALNNDASVHKESGRRVGDPTEIALVEAALKANVDVEGKRDKFKRTREIPFSSDLKYMATVHSGDLNERLIVKGAPEVVFSFCLMDSAQKKYFEDVAAEMTQAGLRVLAVAFLDKQKIDLEGDLKDLTCLGLAGMQDALRPDAIVTVETLKKAGVRTVVVTGDHLETAANIARSAGISIRENGSVTGGELDEMTDVDLVERINEIDLFARVDPKHKVRIVNAWQTHGKCVAMTGDGVNDAPALRAADIGVALGAGSDLSHEIADMVLLDNKLSTITAAVQEGRVIFDNIRKVIVYLLVDSFSEIVLIGLAISFGMPSPLTAIQILWINLVSDGFP